MLFHNVKRNAFPLSCIMWALLIVYWERQIMLSCLARSIDMVDSRLLFFLCSQSFLLNLLPTTSFHPFHNTQPFKSLLMSCPKHHYCQHTKLHIKPITCIFYAITNLMESPNVNEMDSTKVLRYALSDVIMYWL